MKRLFTALMAIIMVVTTQSCDSDDCAIPCTQMALVYRERDRSMGVVDEILECNRDSELGLQFISGEKVEIDCECELPFRYVRYDGTIWLFINPETNIFE